MNFTNKTAIVTGAASGMGLLFSQNFAALGGRFHQGAPWQTFRFATDHKARCPPLPREADRRLQ